MNDIAWWLIGLIAYRRPVYRRLPAAWRARLTREVCARWVRAIGASGANAEEATAALTALITRWGAR